MSANTTDADVGSANTKARVFRCFEFKAGMLSVNDINQGVAVGLTMTLRSLPTAVTSTKRSSAASSSRSSGPNAASSRPRPSSVGAI